MIDYLTALFLGFVEGLTEFIPVSSTGHLILLVEGLNFPAPPGRVFEVFIQIGAILAIMVLYRAKILSTVIGLPHDAKAQRFALNIIIGTVPALLFGALLHDFIKERLYDPMVIAAALFAGAIVILFFERRAHAPDTQSIDDVTPRQAFLIGLAQSVALIPGVSRSGATIIGSLALGLTRQAAAEFSFFLAMPVMLCAVAYDVVKNWQEILAADGWGLMLTGMLAAFVTALLVVKTVIGFISRHGFAPFAYYRIILALAVVVIFW